ncbi:recombinase-like helix-turn-helix domain-containing protein [Saccharospirillum salsuginis]|uniref:Recombinase-like domain-containing protein n=1 Tax=Saccharospirillum salsuginis TaxID=418750 RepID=A0A918K3B0_9GAMM|nr:recombinase-like helix-turn-helix domain-containing protein [Saccharospirillum salsuginis]GGX45148.1 hypothetical protein GCM10007392_10020 [Saccharospirillum salsuginis]
MSQLNYNPQLKQWERIIPATEPGQGRIEQPGGFDNRVWQNRDHEPEAFELALVEALESVFEDGATELDQVVAGLNRIEFKDRQGNAWTDNSVLQELAVLGQ